MRTILLSSAAAVALSAALAAHAHADAFNRVASFPVNTNIPDAMGQESESSAEIIDATGDGMMLVYSDSPLGGIGMIDISDPANPAAAGFVALDGEPTAVAVRAGCPILVEPGIVDEVGLQLDLDEDGDEDAESAGEDAAEQVERFKEFLDHVSPEDFERPPS